MKLLVDKLNYAHWLNIVVDATWNRITLILKRYDYNSTNSSKAKDIPTWKWNINIICQIHMNDNGNPLTIFVFSYLLVTQQNSYSISHLLGTVTTQWLPLWQCSHCSLVPDTVTTQQWLHRTHTLLGIHYHGGLCRNLSTRHLGGNCTVTTWADTRYPLHTVTV